MQKSWKKTFYLILILVAAMLLYLIINYLTIENLKEIFDFKLIIKIVILLIVLVLINLLNKFNLSKESKYKDKLFNILSKSDDTIYIMIDAIDNKTVYLSDNIEQVLGIRVEKDKNNKIVKDLLNIPILKSELKSWNGKSEYVSGMLSYDNPIYQHKKWIKIKIYPYKDKKNSYNIIQISDVSKEHDRQHLLITQTMDIKSREKQLNQITASSYDVEINVNVITHTYELKYFKQDMKYFGMERSGNFNTDFKEIVEKYINKNDQEEVLKVLSIHNFYEKVSLKELEPITIRYRIGNQIKNNIWLESSVFFITSKEKTMVSILTKNVTENAESIREQNILLQNTLNEAKIANEAKTNLIKTISHDIRIPMTTIKGLSEELLNKNIDNEIKEDIENINDSSIEVLNIINSLLDISKVEKGIIKKEETKYNIFKLFKKIEDNTNEYIGNKNIKLNLNLDSNLPVILYGDKNRLFKVFTNILNNSVKFTDEGIININVNGEKKDKNINLKVAIKDSGCGISEKKLTNIFSENNNSITGLSSIKKIIDLLGGKIEIESKVNEYTLVTVILNQKIVEDNKIREMMQHNQETKAFDLNGKKVLIVDDNKLNLKVAAKMLETYNLNITTIETGQECIDKVKENIYDLILLDQMMPGIDGITTLNKIKKLNNFKTPVVALTADAMEGQKEKYLNAGFNDFLSKPIDKSELSRVLKKYLK